MWKVNPNINNVKPELLEKLGAFPTSILSDAIVALKDERNAIIGNCIHGVKAGLKFNGVALTVKAPGGNCFPVQYALYKGFPGAVLCIDTEKHTKDPYLGELMTRTAQGLGFSAIVIDGFIRDTAEIRNLDYPVFAVGAHPKMPNSLAEGEINVAITLDEVVVHPGDILVGDDDGIVIICPEAAEAVLAMAEKKHQADEYRLANIIKFMATPEEKRDIYSTMGARFAEIFKQIEAEN